MMQKRRFACATYSLSLIALAVCTAQEPPAQPTITNGDFEADEPGAATIGKLPTGWAKHYGHRVLSVVSEARPGSDGTQCLKIGTSDKVRTGGAYSELVPLDPKKGLHVSGWVKQGKPTKNLRGLYFGVGWFDSARKKIVLRKGTTVNYHYLRAGEQKGDWHCLSASFLPAAEDKGSYYFTIPADAAFFDVRVFALNYPAPAWFDDIEARVMTDGEVSALRKAMAAQRKTAAKKRKLTRTKPRPPADLNAEWLVAWQGEKEARDAADELARYIGKVIAKPASSVEWQPNKAKQAFVVTDAAHAPTAVAARLEGKRRDAFAIQYPVEMDGQKVCLMVAHDEDGYDRPVYYFLTRFMDVHWVGPGELGAVLPQTPDWRMPESIDVVENPDFEMRHWYSPSFTCRQWLAAGVRMGFHHALGHVFSPDKHGDTPEVYPLVGGRRFIPKKRKGHYLGGWQPCTGSPKSIEIATKHVLKRLEENPRMATVSLSVNDGAGNICECELCRAQDNKTAFQGAGRPDLSDRFFRFYNAVVERAAEKNAAARVAVLGYGAVKTPPKETRVDPRISVFQVCPSKERLREWHNAGANPSLYMWLWDGGFLSIRPDPNTVAELIREAHRLGGIGFYSECIPHWTVSAPKFYVIAHVLWDTTQDPNELLGRYFRLAYGPAASHVQSFFSRWSEIYRRRPPEEHYRTSWGWRNPEQFEYLRRDDLVFLDAALARATESELTDKQKGRLEYLRRYYQIMRINGEEYLASQELSNEKWLTESDADTILSTAEHTTSLTARFDELYKAHVLEDETGWMIDAKYYREPDKFYNTCVAQLRNTVSSNAGTAIDSALAFMTRQMLKGKPKAEVVSFWRTELTKHPVLASYIGPQINRLEGVSQENIVVNGSFEQGEPGDPPELPAWDFYQFYGMVKGVTARHDWKPGNGHDGGRAIGMGEGRYPEMKAIVEMEKGRRYELSFWYKSQNRDRNASFSVFSYDGPITSPREIEAQRINRLMVIQLEPTDGKWRKFTRALKPPRSGKYVLQLAVYYQKPDWWAWFDDVEIRKLW